MEHKTNKFDFYFAWRLLKLNFYLHRYWLILVLALFFPMFWFQDFSLVFFLILAIFLLIGLNNLLYLSLITICAFFALFSLIIAEYSWLQFLGNLLLTLFAAVILSNAFFPAKNKKVLFLLSQEERFGKKTDSLKSRKPQNSFFTLILLFLLMVFFLFFGLNGISGVLKIF